MLGVVGAGRWGRNHVRNFAALGVLGAVCDSSREALGWVGEAHPGVTTYTDLADLLADRSIEAVVIATPAQLHFAQAEGALAAGRHVLVEKPMTLNLADAQALHRMAEKRKLVLMVGHLLEYHPAFVALKELISAGELGETIRVDSRRVSPGASRHREGVLWDLGPHDLSMMLRLLDALPQSVQATGSAQGRLRAGEVVTVNLAFAGGAQAEILLSWRHPRKERSLVVVGRRKTAVFDDTLEAGKLRLCPTGSKGPGSREQEAGSRNGAARGPDPDRRYPALQPLAASPCPLSPGLCRLICYPGDEPLRRECAHFLKCIQTGERPLTDSASGVRVTRVLDACDHSLRAGGAAVTLAP